MSTAPRRKSLVHYLSLDYPVKIEADPDGGFVASFPDLPGCLTQGETIAEVGTLAEDARRLWIETEYEAGNDIPLPTVPSVHSGKFNLRVPRSLHAQLVESAEREGVSLNQYVVHVLSMVEGRRQFQATPALGPND